MQERVASLLADFDRAPSLTGRPMTERLRSHSWLDEATGVDLDALIAGFIERDPPEPGGHAEVMLAAILAIVAARFLRVRGKERETLSAEMRQRIETLYRRLGPASRARHELLSILAAFRGRDDLRLLAELAAGDSPAVAQRFLAPLFQFRDYDPAPLFPRLLDALEHPALAAAVLDLANYLTREERLPSHPASGRGEQLAALLGSLAQQLGRIEEEPPQAPHEEDYRRVNEGVALAVSLCDALAIIGDAAHAGKLHQALSLGHRRVRTEAAYALARLGDPAGRDALAALAAEPVARLRVLAYAEELGLTEHIHEQFKGPEAQAEAELVAWLSEPTQMGLPPGKCELIDRRQQYWPGYDEPVDCFLFHFSYRLANAVYSNVGIVGPLTHALTADLADLPPDDIYAAFAGWQAEHEELFEIEAERLTSTGQREAERLVRRLHDAGYQAIEPVKLGYFFGDRVLVAAARRDGVPGYAVVDFHDIDWRPTAQRPRPLGPDEVYCIYKGRKLLKAFNP
jgi:hypothetical protein